MTSDGEYDSTLNNRKILHTGFIVVVGSVVAVCVATVACRHITAVVVVGKPTEKNTFSITL